MPLYNPSSSIGNLISFTPTGSWNTNVTYTGKTRLLGDNLMEAWYYVLLSGAPNAATLTLDLPPGVTIDTSMIPGAGASGTFISLGTVGSVWDDSTSQVYNIQPFYDIDTNTIYVMTAGSPMGFASQAAPITFANDDSVTVYCSFPIS